jgi:hypothetical protein
LFSDWLPNQPNSETFRVQAADVDQELLNDLVEAVLAYTQPTTNTTNTKA